jgi:hypothetical protein
MPKLLGQTLVVNHVQVATFTKSTYYLSSAGSPIAPLVQLEENGGANLVISEHEFTYDTLKGQSYVLSNPKSK